MAKLKTTIWDIAMAMIAGAGGLTLINICYNIVRGLFITGFAIILFKLGWDIYDAVSPIRLISSNLESMVNGEQTKLTLKLYFNVLETVRINKKVKMKFDKPTRDALTELKNPLPDTWNLNSDYSAPFIILNPEVSNVVGEHQVIPLKDASDTKKMQEKLQTILSASKIKIGWYRIHKWSCWYWSKTTYNHITIL